MSTPQPNASTPPTVPPVITVPTTPLGAAQTLISLLSPPGASQGTPSAQSALASLLQMSADASAPASTSPASASAPPAPAPASPSAPAPATQTAADPADPAAASVSSHGGREHTPPRGTARVTRSYPALPEPSHPPARPIPIPGGDGYRRLTAHYADSETAWQARDDGDLNREKSVALRLKPTIDAATVERDKAAQKAKWTGLALNIALGLQVLLGALTTALGAALSGKSTSVAISILGGSSTFVASYLARMRGSNEPQTSLLRAKALNHFLREIQAFALDHGHEVGREWDEKVNGFRLGLENMLGNQPGSVTINPEAAGLGLNPSAEKGGLNAAGKFPTSATNAKLGFTTV
ncbi:hypothetical protein BJY52DRAFT_1279301 [Lactarius psammicola]|nr:hypothetical protein BJY52DRAFT_1279301 [Lactarius psammicola]